MYSQYQKETVCLHNAKSWVTEFIDLLFEDPTLWACDGLLHQYTVGLDVHVPSTRAKEKAKKKNEILLEHCSEHCLVIVEISLKMVCFVCFFSSSRIFSPKHMKLQAAVIFTSLQNAKFTSIAGYHVDLRTSRVLWPYLGSVSMCWIINCVRMWVVFTIFRVTD